MRLFMLFLHFNQLEKVVFYTSLKVVFEKKSDEIIIIRFAMKMKSVEG